MKTVFMSIVLALVVIGVIWMAIDITDGGGKKGKSDGGQADGTVITTDSGLKYIEVQIGEGKVARAGNTVFVHYTGTLKNGTKFDSSHDRGEPIDFKLGAGRVIKGWDEGIADMKEGGRRKLIIPSELGYGQRGSPPKIPPGAELHFDVELVKVN